MTPSRPRRFTLKHAFGLSTMLHVLIAPFFIVSGAVLFATGNLSPLGLPGDERLSMATVTFIQRAAAHVAARVRERSSSRALPDRPQAKAAQQTAHLARAERANAPSAELRPALVAAAPTAAPLPTAAPVTATQPTAAAVVMTSAIESSRGDDVPSGGWGQSFEHPLVADEGALSDLRAKYHFAAAITVDVDRDGHAVKIDFPPAIPADVRDEIEKRLTALRYIPAECNGLRCAAPLTVRI